MERTDLLDCDKNKEKKKKKKMKMGIVRGQSGMIQHPCKLTFPVPTAWSQITHSEAEYEL